MALTSGFFNAQLVNDHPDRVYGSEEFGALFDGVISDGIFKNYKDAFKVTLGEPVGDKLRVYVGPGRAWFDKTWTLNTSPLELLLKRPSPTGYRMDAIVLEVNFDTRENKFKVIEGTTYAAANVSVGELIRTTTCKQYLIATVFIGYSTPVINDVVSITDKRNTGGQSAPYAKPIEPVTSTIDGIIDSLETEFNSYQKTYQIEFNEWMDSIVGHLGTLTNEQTVRLALMIGEVYRSDYISGEYPYVDDDGGLWLSASDNGEKPSVDINFGYASLPYAANGRATEVIIQTSEYTIVEEE